MAVEGAESPKEETALVQIVQASGLEKTKADFILEKFQDYFRIAADWEKKAKALVVTSADQVAEMKMAREGRLYLKNKRVEIERVRKELKEQSLREGKAIDGIANVLKALIEPTENYLDQQERFVEIQDEQCKNELSATRQTELIALGMFPELYDLKNMPQDSYTALIEGRKAQIRAEEETRQKAEEERIAREAEEKRMREENERLKREREDQDRHAAEERAKAEAEQRRLREEAEKQKRESEERERKLKAEQETKLRKEREERARVEAELKAKQDAEEKERKRLAVEEEKAARAPDKVKLQKLAAEIAQFPLPEVKSEEAKAVLVDVRSLLNKTAAHIHGKISGL